MKKIVSLLLIATVVFSATTMSFAAETKGAANGIRKEILTGIAEYKLQEADVRSDLKKLRQVGIPDEALSIHGVDKNNQTVYDYQVTEGIVDKVTVGVREDGATEYTFVENGIRNTLTVLQDGILLLDGYEVKFLETTSPTNRKIGGISLCGYSTQKSLTPLSGEKSDYKIFIKTYEVEQIDLGAKIASLGTGVLATAITVALEAGMAISIYATVVSSGAAALISMAKDNPTYNGTWASCLVNKYGKTGNTTYSSYYMYKVNFYPNKECKGAKTYHEYYEYRYYG